MFWEISHRADRRVLPLADRHYNRQKIGTSQFVPPGRCVVLWHSSDAGQAFWVTSWPFAEYVRHAWPGAWICSAFRNESTHCASALITEALSVTRGMFGDPPAMGCITFIDRKHVKPIKVRGCKTWGRSYEKAGFRHVGFTKGGLMAMQLLPDSMPRAIRINDLFGDAA